MAKKISSEDLERRIYQITIADLANSDNVFTHNEPIEFKDIKMSFDLFKYCFYDNNYKHFDLNSQIKDMDEISINNKIIKQPSVYKNYESGTKVNIIDIMTLKYIENKKTKLDDIKKLSLVKDFNKYNTLIDFKMYNTHLGVDDILTLFNHYHNKNSKKYFRFKIKTTYYSVDLDESISMYFNYLVKIPKNMNSYKTTDDHESILDDDSIIHDDSIDELNNEVENIVYSNYIKKVNDELIEHHHEDDSISSDSNISVSSFEMEEDTDGLFF